MKVCGFTFIRNAVKYDFPVAEAITSVLPLCDLFIVAAGNSDDETRTLIENIDPGKIRITDSTWDESLTKGGAVYAAETDKAFDAVPPEFDWCFYIQGDEVLHEKYLPAVKLAMLENLHRTEVEGLLFSYRHFFGTYDYTGDSRKWYRNEIRVIRNDKSIRSYRDAQGFRKMAGSSRSCLPTQKYTTTAGFAHQNICRTRSLKPGSSTLAMKPPYPGRQWKRSSTTAATMMLWQGLKGRTPTFCKSGLTGSTGRWMSI
jgi:hypothetical protein